jgi:hypothetical protein
MESNASRRVRFRAHKSRPQQRPKKRDQFSFRHAWPPPSLLSFPPFADLSLWLLPRSQNPQLLIKKPAPKLPAHRLAFGKRLHLAFRAGKELSMTVHLERMSRRSITRRKGGRAKTRNDKHARATHIKLNLNLPEPRKLRTGFTSLAPGQVLFLD